VEGNSYLEAGRGEQQQPGENRVLAWMMIVTAVSAGALLIVPFPHEAEALLHHAATASVPTGLLLELAWPSGQMLVGWFLLTATPLLAARLAFLAVRHRKSGPLPRIGLWLSLAAMAIFVVYYAHTYHTGVLILAVLAWVVAATHAGEISGVSQEVDTARRQMRGLFADAQQEVKRLSADTARGLRAVARTNAEHFYEDFYRSVRKSTSRILSIERVWTMENELWPRLTELQCERYPRDLTEFVTRLQDESDLYQNIAKSSADDILFIGPFPQRDRHGSFTEESFRELMALVSTVCLLELIRGKRLGERDPGASDDAAAWPRVECAIGDVPAWAKVVDDDCWFLVGNASGNFYFNKPNRTDARQLRTLERMIELHEHNARRAHEHIKLAILRAGVELELADSERLDLRLDDIVLLLITGKEKDEARRCLDELVASYKEDDPAMEDVKPGHVFFLFKLFIILFFRKSVHHDARVVSDALTTVTMRELWESVA
jgi:hypothetical protein